MLAETSGSFTVGKTGDALHPTNWLLEQRQGTPLQAQEFCLCFLFLGAPWTQWDTYPLCPQDTRWDAFLETGISLTLSVSRKKRLIFLCNTAGPQYKLGDRETWPENGSSNDNTVLQLHLFCRRLAERSELPYIQAFFVLPHAPSLCCRSKETSTLGSPDDILDGPLLSSTPVSQRGAREALPLVSQGERGGASSLVSQGEPSRPHSPETSAPESTTTTSSPPNSPIHPK